MKQLGVLPLPPEWDATPLQGYPPTGPPITQKERSFFCLSENGRSREFLDQSERPDLEMSVSPRTESKTLKRNHSVEFNSLFQLFWEAFRLNGSLKIHHSKHLTSWDSKKKLETLYVGNAHYHLSW